MYDIIYTYCTHNKHTATEYKLMCISMYYRHSVSIQQTILSAYVYISMLKHTKQIEICATYVGGIAIKPIQTSRCKQKTHTED